MYWNEPVILGITKAALEIESYIVCLSPQGSSSGKGLHSVIVQCSIIFDLWWLLQDDDDDSRLSSGEGADSAVEDSELEELLEEASRDAPSASKQKRGALSALQLT